MPAIPSTVDVKCPRCDVPIVCTLECKAETPKPGSKPMTMNVSVPDLAERIRDHYAAAHGMPQPITTAFDE